MLVEQLQDRTLICITRQAFLLESTESIRETIDKLKHNTEDIPKFNWRFIS